MNNKSKVKHESLYYVNPKNLISALEKMGIKKPLKTIIVYYFAFIGLALLSGYLLKLEAMYVTIMIAFELFIVPLCIKCHYQKGYEDKRFSEVNQYIEQLLYSFKESKKVLKSLSDIAPMFKNSEMGQAIDCMMQDIDNYDLETACRNFERKYDCQKVKQLHKFLCEVEATGGEHENIINILLQDRSDWAERTLSFQKEKRSKKITNIASIIASFVLVIAMERMLPGNVDISHNFLVEVSAVLVFVLDLFLYYKVEAKCCQSILNTLKERKDSEIKKYYEYIQNYDAKTEFVKGLKMLPIPLSIVITGLITNMSAVIIVGVVMSIWFLFNYKIVYNSRLKTIKDEINIQFPRWLMQMALLTQSNSVQVALFKSIPEAPTVLKPELIKLHNALREDVVSVDPYLNFMKEFELPEITASLKMFYAITSGAGSDAQKQVNDIIQRNNKLIDKAERIAFDNSLGGMYMLFLLPQLTGGAKLIMDMMIFFGMILSSTATVM